MNASTTEAPLPDALDVALAGRQALSDRCERLAAALVMAAEAFDEMADARDGTRLFASAVEYRQRARECREAAR